MAEAAFVRTWRVGRYTATLSAPRPKPGEPTAAVIEWSPRMPAHLSDRELAEYHAGRDAAVSELARVLGITVGIVDL